MRMRQKQTFIVVNGKGEDMEPVHVTNLRVQWCDNYTQGRLFPVMRVLYSVKLHATEATLKLSHNRKFVSLTDKYNDLAFVIKSHVFNAALTSRCSMDASHGSAQTFN